MVSLVLGGLGVSSALAAPGDIYPLGTEYPESYANAINNAGQMVGYVSDGWNWWAFLYTGTPGVDGQLIRLGSLDGPNGYSAAYGISNAGHIVGDTDLPNGNTYAFLYTGTPGVNGQMTSLGSFGGNYSYANGVNDLGQVVGAASISGGQVRAFLYSDGQMHNLGTLGGIESWANAINNSGQIVGAYRVSGTNYRAFLYTGTPGSDGVMQSLGALPGGSRSEAYDINDAGLIVGEAETGDGYTAFLYMNGQMYDLGNLGDRDSWSTAYAINSHGHIVGYSELSRDEDWAHRAFLYLGTPGVDGQMINLDAWLDEVNPVEGAKWTLEVAYDINDSGLIIGQGWYDDGSGSKYRAFVLEIPEPASLSLLLGGAVGLLHRRRRLVG